MALQLINWLMVLGQADLSYAKPVASLSYACVPAVSVLMLHEAIDGFEIAGCCFRYRWRMVHQPDKAHDGGHDHTSMTGTTFGILLVILCAFLEGLGQVFLKKSVLTKVRWFMWISAGVVVLALEALIYTEARNSST